MTLATTSRSRASTGRPTARCRRSSKVTIALVAFDFADQPFVITQPKKSDPFGNPQIDPIPRADVPKFYADFYNTPDALNNGHTINGYWMEQSGGKVGITDVKTYGPYRMPKKLYQYGLNDIGQQGKPTGNGCPASTTSRARRRRRRRSRSRTRPSSTSATSCTFGAVTPTGTKTVTAIPDATHITVSVPITVAAGASRPGLRFSTPTSTPTRTRSGTPTRAAPPPTAARRSTCSSTPATTRPRSGRSSAR